MIRFRSQERADCIASLLNVHGAWTAINWKEKHCKMNNNLSQTKNSLRKHLSVAIKRVSNNKFSPRGMMLASDLFKTNTSSPKNESTVFLIVLQHLLITESILSLGGPLTVKSSATVGYMNAILAQGAGIWTSQSSKVQMPGALPGGWGDVDVSNWSAHYFELKIENWKFIYFSLFTQLIWLT